MQPQGRFMQISGNGGQGSCQRRLVKILHEEGASHDQGNEDSPLKGQCSCSFGWDGSAYPPSA
jgi:hypothetical protein